MRSPLLRGSAGSGRAAAQVQASKSSLSFVAPTDLSDEGVDVQFDGHRVWSTDVTCRTGHVVRLEWPLALSEMLIGTTEMAIARGATGEILVQGIVRFDDSRERTTIQDARGRRLTVNKWGNLGVPFASRKRAARKRLLRHAREIMSDLERLGFRPFLSSGSLLGAIRTGSFLPHDDDVDLGNVTDTQHPAALILESERIERSLASLGYRIVRHSHAHLQIVFMHKSGDVDHYIDVFTAYFDPNGTFNQPFSIRGELPPEALEPFSVVELEGEKFRAPAHPEKWLELNYGAGWRIPDAGHKFDISEDTRRRFDSWFGSFNGHRDFWEVRQVGVEVSHPADTGFVDEVLGTVPNNSTIADIGCGLSGTASALAASGRAVLAADFSLPVLRAQSERLGRNAAIYLNLNDRHSAFEFALVRAATGRGTSLLFEHVLEGLGGEAKENAMMLMRWILRGADVAVVTLDTDLPVDNNPEDPTSWHLTAEDFARMAASTGLSVRVIRRGTRMDDRGRTRETAHLVVSRNEGERP